MSSSTLLLPYIATYSFYFGAVDHPLLFQPRGRGKSRKIKAASTQWRPPDYSKAYARLPQILRVRIPGPAKQIRRPHGDCRANTDRPAPKAWFSPASPRALVVPDSPRSRVGRCQLTPSSSPRMQICGSAQQIPHRETSPRREWKNNIDALPILLAPFSYRGATPKFRPADLTITYDVGKHELYPVSPLPRNVPVLKASSRGHKYRVTFSPVSCLLL